MPKLPAPKLKKWTREKSDRAGHFRIFSVERHWMRDGSGVSRGDFYVVESPDWCNVVAVTDDDRLVMVWQYRFGSDELSLEIPGGVVDPGETPLESARRELLEETGYEAASIEPLLVVEPNPAIQNNRCHTFVARGARMVAAQSLDIDEEMEVVLVPVSDLPELLDSGTIRHSLVQGALETFLRKR